MPIHQGANILDRCGMGWPPIDAIERTAWLGDPAMNALVPKLEQRRTPIAEANNAIANFANQARPDRRARLLTLFSGLFETFNKERSDVVAGLERLGKHQNEMAGEIRTEATACHTLQGTPSPDPQRVQKAADSMKWNLRIFQEKRKSVQYVCESPTLIAQRLFALGRTIQEALQ